MIVDFLIHKSLTDKEPIIVQRGCRFIKSIHAGGV